MPGGGTPKDENSPPPEGCRGGLSRAEETHPEGSSLLPLPGGDFQERVEELEE